MGSHTFSELVKRVDSLAASVTVARGRAYYQRKRVIRLLVGGTHAVASVRGNRKRHYTVSLTLTGDGDVKAVCDCPHPVERCKHVIACLLAAAAEESDRVDEGGPAAPAGKADRQQARARGTQPSGAPQVALDMDRADLQAWARHHDVQIWLHAVGSAAGLPGEAGPPSRAWARPHNQASLSKLVVGSDSPQFYWHPAVPPRPLREEALRILQALPAEARAATQQHKQWLAEREPPAPGLVRTVWDALERLRLKLLPRAPIVSARAWGGQWQATLTEDPPTLALAPARSPFCPHGRRRRLYFRATQRGSEVTIQCGRGCLQDPCPLELAAVEEGLRQLAEPTVAQPWSRWAELVQAAPWERLMARVTAALGGEEARQGLILDGVPAELGWRITSTWEGVRLEPLLQRPRKSGGSGVVQRKLSWDRLSGRLGSLPLPQDRLACLLAAGGERVTALPPELVFDALVGHPRVFWQDGRRRLGPIEVRREPAELVVARGPHDEVQPRLRLGSQEWPLDVLALEEGPVEGDGCWIQLELEQRWISLHPVSPALATLLDELRRDDPEPLPAEAGPALVAALTTAPDPLPCTIDATLAGAPIEPDCAPLVHLAVDGAASLEVAFRCRPLVGGASHTPGEGPAVLYATLEQTPRHCRRDLDAERAAARALAAALKLPGEAVDEVDPAAIPFAWHIEALEPALQLLERLQRMDAPPPVEWQGRRRYSVSSPAGAVGLKVSVKRHRDWFGLAGALDAGDSRIPLAGLLEAIRERRAFVQVGPDQWARLEEGLRRALGPVSRARARSKGEIELSPFACAELELLEEAGATVEQPRAWRRVRQRLQEAEALEPQVPASLRATLRGYQRAGYAWLMRLAHWGAGGCLADDMGLGKTVQALAVLLARAERGPALVLAPTSVGHNWIREGQRFAPGLELLPFRGRAQRERLVGLRAGQVLVTSYNLAARYADELGRIEFATLVLDEAQAIKNPATQRAKAVFGLQAEFRFALTGTPLENRTGELWSLFRAVLPGLLGSQRGFREQYATPIERDGDEHARHALARRVRPFILRRLKQEVAPELPPRTDVQVDVELGPEQRRLYERLRQATLAELTNPRAEQGRAQQRRFRVLAALTRLRQLACHPKLCDPASRARSAKLDRLLRLLAEVVAEGHRALVFSQFTTLLGLVRAALDRVGTPYRYLDGSTPVAKRCQEIDAFQRGAAPVFLLSLKAGGTGVNLTAADYVFHLDPWWNPAVEDQATDRAHRIGQQRPVTVLKLVARDTVEDTILALHADKRELVERLLDGTNSAAPLGTEELLALLEQGPAPAVPLEECRPEESSPPPRSRARAYLAAPPATSPTPAETLLVSLDGVLERARDEGALATSTASRAYRRVGGRVVAFAAARGLSLAPEDLAATVQAYRVAIKAGDAAGPSSDFGLARSALSWLQRAATEIT